MYIRSLTEDRVPVIRGYIDMKLIRKTSSILRDNSGETIVEVLVAFTVLSIMLLVFAEGLQMATRSEVTADQSRKSADAALANVQRKIANGESFGTAGSSINISSGEGNSATIVPYTYTVDGNTFVVYKAG